MNPDKLFDYLDGRLPPSERVALEERLMSDKQLQREFAVARQIHSGMRGDSQEVVLPAPPDVPEQGHKMAIRVGVAFMILMLVNVGIGLWFIFKHESKNPNRPLLEAQMRQQIAKSIERAAALTPAPNVLGVTEITISAATGKMDSAANEVVAIAGRLGGSATKGLQDSNRLSVLVDVPSNRDQQFRAQVASIAEETPASPASAIATADKPTPATAATPATGEKKSFIVQIVETTPR
jgi:anti-sigma factor RsiW